MATELVAEFTRAANQLPKVSLQDRQRLLERGVTVSEAMRGLLVKTGKVAPFDEAIEDVIHDIAGNIFEVSDETVAKAFLTLADQIRTLRIINREPT